MRQGKCVWLKQIFSILRAGSGLRPGKRARVGGRGQDIKIEGSGEGSRLQNSGPRATLNNQYNRITATPYKCIEQHFFITII